MDLDRARARGPARRRSQICASEDALLALDEGGNVYQYNFERNTWAKLAADRDRGQENLDARVRTLAIRYQRRSAVWGFLQSLSFLLTRTFPETAPGLGDRPGTM